jgi:hypothetical protein
MTQKSLTNVDKQITQIIFKIKQKLAKVSKSLENKQLYF